MKKDRSTIVNKEPLVPNWEESDFAKTVDGQIMLMVKKAISNGHFVEAQMLSWSTIDQILMPRLIGWIANTLKLKLPKGLHKLNAQSINMFYLAISHDTPLFGKLEEARKSRNKITHQLVSLGVVTKINEVSKGSTKSNILLQQEIMKRFNGEILIPSINLYRSGWNDGLDGVIKMLEKGSPE
ncbi:MAG: hypothetical protein WC880_00550 [Candidatus Paceibacterota bacterium]